MLTERPDSRNVRRRFRPDEILAFLPTRRGRFRFPEPYGTEGVRLTSVEDCPGGVDSAGYAYWPQVNAHAGRAELLAMVGCNRQRDGRGPSLFAYDKVSGVVEPRGPLFNDHDPMSWATGEGWRFSFTDPDVLYILDGSALVEMNVKTRSRKTIFSAPEGTYLWQSHTSRDGQTHSATLRKNDTYEVLGAITHRPGMIELHPSRGQFDECQVDKSGRWLVIKEGDDNRVIDLDLNVEHLLSDLDGAVGHSDLGAGYMIGEDDRAMHPGSFRRWRLTEQGPIGGEIVYYMTDWAPMARHVSHCSAQPFVVVSCAHREDLPRANEIVLVPLDGSLTCRVLAPTMVDLEADGSATEYERLPKASVDPSGEYAFWTSNMGSPRLDAFLVKVGTASVPDEQPKPGPIVVQGDDMPGDYGLVVRVTEKTPDHQDDNQGPPVAGATVSGALVPAQTDADGNATLETVNITVRAPGFISYENQPYHRPSLQGPVAVSLQRA